MKRVMFIIGNFGIGKSTLIEPWFGNVPGNCSMSVLSNYEDWEILGTSIGADGLSKYKKAEVFSEALSSGLNFIVAGVYYQQKVDIDRFVEAGYDVYCTYLDTPKYINKARVAGRNGKWNENTYQNKVGAVRVFMEKCEAEGHPIYKIDNSRLKKEVREEFDDIMENIDEYYKL